MAEEEKTLIEIIIEQAITNGHLALRSHREIQAWDKTEIRLALRQARKELANATIS